MKFSLAIFVFLSFVQVGFTQCLHEHTAASNTFFYGNNWETETTGDIFLDEEIFQSVQRNLQRFKIQIVDVYFCDENNAYARPRKIHQISLGIPLIDGYKEELGVNWYLAFEAIIAHELGHVLQFEYGGINHLEGFQKELHADFLAGYFIGYNQSIELATAEDAAVFFDVFYELGDNSFTSPFHHGTSSQRKKATIAGWKYGKLMHPINQAYSYGKRLAATYRNQGY